MTVAAAGRGRVVEEFATSTGRVAAVLRLPLVALMSLVGSFVSEPQMNPGLYASVLAGYAVWSLGVVWWVFHRPVPGWHSWLTTGVDFSALIVLAAASNGTTSYLQPFFYLYPIGVAIHCRPALTATVGSVMAGAYAAVWLRNLGINGGPGIPSVVWLHFGMLVWLAVATTVLTKVLVRRSAGVLELLEVQRQLTAESLALQERERARIAEHLHDGPLQNIIAARRNLEALGDLLPGDPLLAQTDDLLRETAAELRGTVTVLHPQVLAQLGLAPALAELVARYAGRSGLVTHTNLTDVGRPAVQELLYSTARELLGNVLEHARASNVWVGLTSSENRLQLSVADDGTGLDPAALGQRLGGGHIGLASHSVRISELGGQLTVAPRQPRGTTVLVDVPVDVPEGHPLARATDSRADQSSPAVAVPR